MWFPLVPGLVSGLNPSFTHWVACSCPVLDAVTTPPPPPQQAPGTISSADPLPLPVLRNVGQQMATPTQPNATADSVTTIWTFESTEAWVLAASLRQQNDGPVW